MVMGGSAAWWLEWRTRNELLDSITDTTTNSQHPFALRYNGNSALEASYGTSFVNVCKVVHGLTKGLENGFPPSELRTQTRSSLNPNIPVCVQCWALPREVWVNLSLEIYLVPGAVILLLLSICICSLWTSPAVLFVCSLQQQLQTDFSSTSKISPVRAGNCATNHSLSYTLFQVVVPRPVQNWS